MSNIVRAWKDVIYRQSLAAEEQTMLPANPAGEIELKDGELEALFGASGDGGREEVGSAAQSSATTSQNGGLNIALPDINALIPVLSLPIGTQQNPTQCASGATSGSHG